MESLQVNRALLDPKFEGYKFSPEELNIFSTCLPSAVNRVLLKDDVFSLKHLKAFGITNHLLLDMWNTEEQEKVYFVDETQQIMRAVVQGQVISSVSRVFQVPSVQKIHDQVNISLSFPSSQHAVLSDGVSKLLILHTGDREVQNTAEWKIVVSHDMMKPCIILHTLFNSSTNTLSCLLLSIDSDAESKPSVVLDLLLFSHVPNAENPKFTLEEVKQFTGTSVPSYAAVEPSNKAILLASENPFSLVSEDSTANAGTENSSDRGDAESKAAYTWSQSNGFVTITFDLPENTLKGDVCCDIQPESLNIEVGQKSALQGKLYAKVNSSESTWTLEGNKLEVHLVKQQGEHHWTSIVPGDERGVYSADPAEMDRRNEVLKTLDQFTSDKLVDPSKPSVMCEQQLESCDDVPEEWVYILRMEIESGKISHKVSLSSHQWLFTSHLKADSAPAFCLRHDVDGLVWQPKSGEDEESQWEHIGTFNAFGYVQASKQKRKFSLCSPSLSFAVICDNSRHAYIYRQTKKDEKNAVQHVVTLDSPDKDILGIQASEDKVFILTSHALYVVEVC